MTKKKKLAKPSKPSTQPKPVRVLVGLPTYGPQHASVGDCFGSLRVLFALTQTETAFLRIEDCSHFNHVMNVIIAKFLSTPKVDTHRDRLLFLDNDILFRPEDAMRIIRSSLDCVGADYAKRARGAGTVAVYNGKSASGLRGAVRMGTGFVCLSRELLERMASKAERYVWEGLFVPKLFEDVIVDGIPELADVTFYRRVREAGGDVWVDPSIPIGHIGTATFEITHVPPVAPVPPPPADDLRSAAE